MRQCPGGQSGCCVSETFVDRAVNTGAAGICAEWNWRNSSGHMLPSSKRMSAVLTGRNIDHMVHLPSLVMVVAIYSERLFRDASRGNQ